MKEHDHHHHEEPTNLPPERLAMCPVMHIMVDKEEAEKLGHVREYSGEKLYFCCATCVQLFDENPTKYLH